MMKSDWTSRTLPELPKRPEWVTPAQYSTAHAARQNAVALLSQAEQLECEARDARTEARKGVEHFATLLLEVEGQQSLDLHVVHRKTYDPCIHCHMRMQDCALTSGMCCESCEHPEAPREAS